MNNPTKEERASKLFQDGVITILAGGGSIGVPTQKSVAEEIGQAQAVAWALGYECGHDETLKDVQKRAEENEALERDTIPTAEVPRQQAAEKPIHVSLLMNVDQDKAKGSFMLHDWIDIDGMNFQSAVRVADRCFKLAVVELHQALRAWRNAPPENIHKT